MEQFIQNSEQKFKKKKIMGKFEKSGVKLREQGVSWKLITLVPLCQVWWWWQYITIFLRILLNFDNDDYFLNLNYILSMNFDAHS